MTERKKLALKPNTPTRDPRRRPVRGGMAPQPPQRVWDERDQPVEPRRQQAPQMPDQRPASGPALRPKQASTPSPAANPRVRPAPRNFAAAAMPIGRTGEGVRLSKILSDRGLASRREADDWIAAGWVRVDGRLAILGQRIGGHERIDIDPAARQQQARQVTILLNKPLGYVSGQAEDGYEPASVLVKPATRWSEDNTLPWQAGFGRNLAPAGRLDIDSTGLLVLTQDGRIARHLIGENSNVEKEYLVRVEPAREGSFHPDDIERLRDGLFLDEQRLKPAKVSWANEDQLRFVLREGRKRQIRRMCELVGLKVLALKRVRIGQVVLGKLPVGQWRVLRDDERF